MTRTQKKFVGGTLILAILLVVALALAVAPAVTAYAGNGLEVVSVGGNPVSAELGDGKFTNGAFPLGHVGEAYSATLVAEGGSGSYTWAIIVGSLVPGLTLDADTGVVSGTPTGTARGSVTVRVTDKNDGSLTDNVELTFNVAADDWAPSISTATLKNAVVENDYNEDVEIDVGLAEEINWSIVGGTLPTGLDLGKDGNFFARIYGTPTAIGTYTFTLKAENNFGSDTQEYTIVVDNLMTLSYPEGEYYLGDTVQLTASIGNSNVDWSLGAHADGTTVSATGLLTIGDDETRHSIVVYASSKTNAYNGNYAEVRFTNKKAYSITIIGGTSTDSTDTPISKAAEGDTISIDASEIVGKQFREWTVEAGSAAVVLSNENDSHTYFDMPAGDVILKSNYDTVIDTVSATFDTPVNGQHVDQTLTTREGYTARIASLWKGTPISLDDTIYETGQEYCFCIQFAATEGYVLVDKSELSVTINGTQLNYGDDYIPTDSSWRIYLTAVTDEIPHYVVTVESGIADKSLAEENETITITANPPAVGYVFDKWTTESGVTFANANSMETTFVMLAKAVTVTATYKVIPQYTVFFEANGGTATMVEQVVNEGTAYELPACSFIAPTNKQFKCWSVGDVEKNVGDTITVNADTTVKAVWVFITHTVSFDENGSTASMSEEQADQGSAYTLPACTLAAPEGKEFKCWLVGDVEMNAGDRIVVNGDISVKAVWKDAETPAEPEQPGETEDPQPAEPSVDPEEPTTDLPPVVETKPEEKGGLSAGAIAGIVVGCVLGALLLACLVLFLLQKKGVVKIAFLSKLFEKKDAPTALPEGEKTEEAKTTETLVRNESDGKEE